MKAPHSRPRSVRVGVTSALVATSVIGALLAGAPGASAAPPGASSAPPGGMQPGSCLSASQVSYLDASGAAHATAAAGLATRYTFNSGGTKITSVVPPAGWSPLTATDTELRTYGFRARPSGGAALASWRKRYANFKGVVTPRFCVGSRLHEPPSLSTSFSGNWSGIIGDHGGYTEADSEWDEPSFVAACPSQSSYSMWPGIGGFVTSGGKFKLIQAGTDTGTSGPNDPYTWVELISTDHQFPELTTNAPVATGDTIAVGVAWDAANQGVAFEFYNITQGWDGVGEITAVNGVAANQFYDGGTTAEVISERATSGGKLLQLRKPSSGFAQYFGADFNGSPVVNDNTLDTITMTSGGHDLSTVDNMYVGVGSNTTYWQTTWHACS